MKQIIESTSGRVCDPSSTIDSMVEQVREILSVKRFLLVLDDAWSEDQEEWDKLKHVLECGLPGSCVVVTTRSEMVASMIRTHPTHYLLPLSEDDCWKLFRQQAFGSGGNEEKPELVAIGREIVKKCGGVPLAPKSLGGMLRFRREDEWASIKESDLWNIPEEECPILPALRLSYYYLPLSLRSCFSYCAVFLKGSLIDKDKLIHLWMANGFISSEYGIQVEEVGNRIWTELYMRSFFQNVVVEDWRDRVYFRMHDLMHDLAQSVARDECQMMEGGNPSSVLSEGIRHTTLVHENTHESMASEALNKHGSLRTLLLQHSDVSSPSYSSKSEFSWDFKNFGSLRAFDASETRMKRLSESVGNLKYLRYLNLSKTLLTELPASLCSLYNLETLNLNDCSELRSLPKNIYNLKNLRHLCLVNCDKIEDMPPEVGKLTQLKTLSLFVVGDSSGLGELHHLNLEGELEIKHLERVRDVMEAKEAKLTGKEKLRVLSLHWSRPESLENIVDELLMESLQPHPDVQVLTIENYKGKMLPVWMENPSVLRNVVHMSLRFCKNCLALPALWQLPCLKLLKIDRMEKVEYIKKQYDTNSVAGVTPDAAFPSLEKLHISNLPNLKGLLMEDEEGGRIREPQPFPRLREMVIWLCPKLVLPKLPVLETLTIWDSTKATVTSISKLTSLTSLHLYNNHDVVSFPDGVFQNLTHLEILLISGFRKLKVLPEDMSRLVALKKLSIESCEEVTCLPGNGIGSLRSLLRMEIYHCPKIGFLPDNIQSLTQLQSLKFSYCNPELKRRCEKGKGEDWYKIAHVPQVIIEEVK